MKPKKGTLYEDHLALHHVCEIITEISCCCDKLERKAGRHFLDLLSVEMNKHVAEVQAQSQNNEEN